MKRGIPEAQLARASTFIARNLGLRFPKSRWWDLKRGIDAAARELGFDDAGSCIEWLLSSKPSRSQIEILASHLTVGETYFFRDKALFKTLEQNILPRLIHSRRGSGKRLRIWSAGCSSGEEPYSIAILLGRLIRDLEDWNISILATDINTRFLEKASTGIYRQWSFRDIEPGIKEVYFENKKDGVFTLRSRSRKMVSFSYLNLVEDTYPSLLNHTNSLDIIFCRNVLMYFVPEFARKVVGNFHRCLVDGGLLIVSPSESPLLDGSKFKFETAPGTVLFRKENPGPARALPRERSEKPQSPFHGPTSAVAAIHDARKPGHTRRPEETGKPAESRSPESGGGDGICSYGQAFALYEEGRHPEAAEAAEKLISKNPSDADSLALLARIYANWGELEKALQYCEKAVTLERLHAGYHFLMATILHELARTEEAVASLKRTLYLDQNFVMAHVSLGNIIRKHGRHEESAKHFGNALLILKSRRPDDILPESGGINAERLVEIIEAMRQGEIGRTEDE
ncbi:MAG: CheR family methyltransferase [Syntrophobacter sp.]